jgi:hypothetical protein
MMEANDKSQEQVSDREFFVLRQVKVQAEKPQLSEGKQASEEGEGLTEDLLGASSAGEQADATEDKWLSVRLSDINDDTEIGKTATVTLQWVADGDVAGRIGNAHLADQSDTFYQYTDQKRVPSCLCFSKTVAGLVVPQVDITPEISPSDLFEKSGVIMPTGHASTVSQNISLSAKATAKAEV